MGGGTGNSAQRRFDLTMLHAAYDAFRRDMARMTLAAADEAQASAAVRSAAVRDGWTLFAFHWRAQHAAEHGALWTAMHGASPGGPAERDSAGRAAALDAALAVVDAQAVRLVALMDTVDAALEHGDAAVLARCARDVPAAVHAHLDHKEAHLLPLIHGTLTLYEWGTFDVELRRRIGLRGLGLYLPWLLDGAPARTRDAVLALLPPPFRLAYRTSWLPRHRRRPLWRTPPV